MLSVSLNKTFPSFLPVSAVRVDITRLCEFPLVSDHSAESGARPRGPGLPARPAPGAHSRLLLLLLRVRVRHQHRPGGGGAQRRLQDDQAADVLQGHARGPGLRDGRVHDDQVQAVGRN